MLNYFIISNQTEKNVEKRRISFLLSFLEVFPGGAGGGLTHL